MKLVDNIFRRRREVVSQNRLAKIRLLADSSLTLCVFASLCEIANDLSNSLPPKLSKLKLQHKELFSRAKSVSTEDFFDVLELFQGQTDLQINQIWGDPSFIKHFKINKLIFDKLTPVTGVQDVRTPNMRILAKKADNNSWKTHAESDLGTEKTRTRISELENNGWQTAMVIEFVSG